MCIRDRNELCLGGSGYDIAVAKEKAAIFYQNSNSRRKFEKIYFNPVFKNGLIFIHLNQKQDSREGINLYPVSYTHLDVSKRQDQ